MTPPNERDNPAVIEAPAVLLSGGDDPIIPPAFVTASQAKFGHLLDIVLLPGVGHFAQDDEHPKPVD